jgi:hypothetical protein
MAKLFNELRERLLHAGIAPRHVRRYLTELADHLADLRAEEERSGLSRKDAESAALHRLGSINDLARAMIDQRQFQSWCVRAPWAIFGIAPLLLLAGAWWIALFILCSGWNLFMPGAATPFIRLNGLREVLYFGIGRLIFLSAPILAGWGIGLIAARQRFSAIWPTGALVLLACIGGTAQVHVTPPSAAAGAGHISMGFTLVPAIQGHPYGLLHTLVILSFTALPYLIWRLQRANSLSA